MPNISELVRNEAEQSAMPQHGYVAFYNQQRIDVWAPSLLAAKEKAVKHFKARKPHMVSVMLAEKDGRPVTHTPDL
jgi:hypothetical protein